VSREPGSGRAWPLRVRDIIAAAQETLEFCAGQTYESFCNDRLRVKAVLANFAIIGEAALHVPDAIKSRHPGVDWVQMRKMRNVIVHVYFGVDAEIVWDTIQTDLPRLLSQLEDLLRSEGA
jgi:uncharacterized protein with HEPN domain